MIPMDRRTVLSGAAAALAAPGLARASAPMAGQKAPGFYRFKLGEYEVTILHDGARTFPLPDQFVTNVPKDRALAAAADAFMPPGKVTVPFNPTLINTGSKLVLIDTGNGPSPDGAVGQMCAKPRRRRCPAGGHRHRHAVASPPRPHQRPAHRNRRTGLPHRRDHRPGARVGFLDERHQHAQAVTPIAKNYFANTRKILTGLDRRIGRYVWGNEVAPGITAIATPGHTPGHTSFAIVSGSARMLVQSDVTNIPEFFLRNPDWHVAYDNDPDLAQQTRHKFYDMAATEKMLVAGYHFAFPSAGHVEKDGTGYRLVPVAWSAAI